MNRNIDKIKQIKTIKSINRVSPEVLSTPREPTALELERLEMDDPEQEPYIEHEHSVLPEHSEEQEISPKEFQVRDSKESLEVFGDGTSFKNDRSFNRNHTFIVPTSTSNGEFIIFVVI